MHARVSKDEDEPVPSPSCFETHRSALACGRTYARARCAAPQHEGSGGRAFWRDKANTRMGAWSERRTNLRVQKKGADEGSLFPACSLQGTSQLERVYGNRAHKLPAGAAQTHPIAAALAGRAAAAGAGKSSVIKARLMVAWRVAEVIFAPNRSVT